MADPIIPNAEIDRILAEAEIELAPFLKSTAEAVTLKKGEGSASPKEKSASASPDGSASASPGGPPGVEGSASPSASGSSDVPPSPSGPPAAGAGAPPSAPPVAGGPPASPAGSPPGASPDAGMQAGGEPTPADLQAIVQQMSPDQKAALYKALKQSMFADQGAGPSAPPAGPGPGAPPMAPPAAGPSPVPPMMGKAEVSSGATAPQSAKPGVRAPDGNGEPVLQSVSKSEVEALKAEMAQLKKTNDEQAETNKLLTRAVEIMTKTPMRKAVTGISEVNFGPKGTDNGDAKPDYSKLSKKEVNEQLKKAMREAKEKGTLSKSDTASILKFQQEGSYDFSLVEKFLK